LIVVNVANVNSTETKDVIVGKGPVNRQELFSPGQTGGFGALLVNFARGARLNFHTHDSEQILFVTSGRGIVATKEKEYVVTPGAVIFIPAGEVHWHGATDDSDFSHLAIQKPGIKLAE
jgi:quercetin dioxygenase-like cupin family protein